jgi:aminoglycoside phosphotransferase (APT) family kinase protein
MNLIGKGATADVYAWGDSAVIKLFKPGFEMNLEKELSLSKHVAGTGLPVPKVIAVEEYRGKRGIVFERIDGPSLFERLVSDPVRISECGRLLAEIHDRIHSVRLPELPNPRVELYEIIRGSPLLESTLITRIVSVLDTLPDGETLCHLDFHPLNVILTHEGSYVIDWTNCKSYHPLADVAMTSTLLQAADVPAKLKEELNRAYLERYLELSGFDYESLIAWQIPIAAARLHENKENEHAAIMRLIETNLSLLDIF